MGKETKIEWTDHTFNPWWGCLKVSPGCEHCYAETFSKRIGEDIWGPAKTTDRRLFGDGHWQKPLAWNARAADVGYRARVFCASMADVFEEHPMVEEPRERLWKLIEETPWLDWQLLTKRPENVLGMVPPEWGAGLPSNVWVGTSVEDQRRADERIPELLGIPARVRFLSCEPLLGPVDLRLDLHRVGLAGENSERPFNRALRWVIVGGESGPGARPMDLSWARSIVRQCRAHGVAPFVKQLGRTPTDGLMGVQVSDSKGGDWREWPEDLRVREMPETQAIAQD